MSLEFNITSIDAVSVISLKGKIITDSDIETIQDQFDKNGLNVNRVFDLSELTHINSSGINFIIKTLTKSRINGGDLVLCNLVGAVKSLFEIAKITDIFAIYGSVSDAINHFKQ